MSGVGHDVRRPPRRTRWFAMIVALTMSVVARLPLVAAEPVPVLVQSAPGRFEIAAVDPSIAHAVAAAAEDAWRFLAAPLGLPPTFPSPIFVRIVPEGSADLVTVEPGGIVSLRLCVDAGVDSRVRRSLVRALLMRLAAARHGASERLVVPRWLEHACAGWWETRADPAHFDAVKQETARLDPPAIAKVLRWTEGGEESRALSVGSLWWLTFLQTESGRDLEWTTFLQRILAGVDPETALAICFPGRFSNADERELWWQTGWHNARRARALPGLDAVEARAQLGALARFVFAGPSEETDRVIPLDAVLLRANETIVTAEIARRAAELQRLVPSLHPFYRNAGLSLAEAFAARAAKPERRTVLAKAFEQDWRDAIELEAATAAALDALEKKLQPSSGAKSPASGS